MDYLDICMKRRGPSYRPPSVMLCLDPGHTTGVAIFKDGKFYKGLQVTTIVEDKEIDIQWDNLIRLFDEVQPTKVVCENYKIYAHKLSQHTFSSVSTLRLIGGIDLICHMRNIPIHYQMALEAKGFVTDDKLKKWNLWQKGMRHSRDAIRHGCYYLVVNKEG